MTGPVLYDESLDDAVALPRRLAMIREQAPGPAVTTVFASRAQKGGWTMPMARETQRNAMGGTRRTSRQVVLSATPYTTLGHHDVADEFGAERRGTIEILRRESEDVDRLSARGGRPRSMTHGCRACGTVSGALLAWVHRESARLGAIGRGSFEALTAASDEPHPLPLRSTRRRPQRPRPCGTPTVQPRRRGRLRAAPLRSVRQRFRPARTRDRRDRGRDAPHDDHHRRDSHPSRPRMSESHQLHHDARGHRRVGDV